MVCHDKSYISIAYAQLTVCIYSGIILPALRNPLIEQKKHTPFKKTNNGPIMKNIKKNNELETPIQVLKKIKRKEYEKALEKLQTELVYLQEWVKKEKKKVCIVFEGRDSAGKGGTIATLLQRVSPRIFRKVALPTPTEKESTQIYFQRYIEQMPAGGEVVVFDRSWYNRAGVEPVMHFCTQEETQTFLEQAPLLEKYFVTSGIILLKYWLEISKEEQEKRIRARIDVPMKRWKLSDIDLQSYKRWYDYSRARDEMLQKTDTAWAPWYIVDANHKKSARLNVISHILGEIPYTKPNYTKVKLPKRQSKGDYQEPCYAYRYVPAKY